MKTDSNAVTTKAEIYQMQRRNLLAKNTDPKLVGHIIGAKSLEELWAWEALITQRAGIRIRIKDLELKKLIDSSIMEPLAYPEHNAGRTGIMIRLDDGEGNAIRIYSWDDGKEHTGPFPGSPAYGPDGVDTGW